MPRRSTWGSGLWSSILNVNWKLINVSWKLIPILLLIMAVYSIWLFFDVVIDGGCDFFGSMTSENNKDHCLKAIAVTFGNSGICSKIDGKDFLVDINGVKFQTENPPKMECLSQVAAKTNDPSLCDQVQGKSIAKTKIDCLFLVAKENKDPLVCEKIGNAHQSRMGFVMDKKACIAQAG